MKIKSVFLKKLPMKNQFYIYTSILLFFLVTNLQAQDVFTKTYTPSALQADFQLFKDNLLNAHPALDAYYPIDSLHQALDQVETQLDQPLSSIEFYRLLTPLNKYIANGHSNFKPSDAFIKGIGEGKPRFPFNVYWDRDSLFVTQNLSQDTSIQVGDRILSVNGRTAKDLIHFFASQQERDGFNTSLPIEAAYESFHTYYAFFIGLPETFELEFKTINGSFIKKTIKGQSLTQQKEARLKRYGPRPKSWWASKTPAYTLDFEGETAIMKLRIFAKKYIKKTGVNYKEFFKSSFEELARRNTQDLIIDLRDNGGGDFEPTIELLAYLYDQSFDFYTEMSTVVNKIPNPKHYEEFPGIGNIYVGIAVKKEGDQYNVKQLKRTLDCAPLNPRFKGQVYVLTNPSSYSATGEMSGVLKSYTNAIFIGEEAGGNPVQNTSGMMLPLVLPNTGVKFQMSFVLFVTNVTFENTGYGILPDYPRRPSFEEHISGEDVVLKYALELAQKK